MNEIEKERERCAQLVTNVLKLHKEHPTIASVLKRLRSKIQHPSPKKSSSSGGPLTDSTPSDSRAGSSMTM